MITALDGGAFRRFAICTLVSVATVSASYAGLSATYFQVTATNTSGSANFVVPSSAATWNPSTQQWEWSTGGLSLMDGATQVAQLGPVSLNIKDDPQISLTFEVQAGAADTIFTVSTATLSFSALNNPDGLVTGALTLTDGSEPPNGANYTGQYLSGNGFMAQYNGAAPTGTSLIEAVPSMATVLPNTSVGSGPFGTFGFTPIAGAVSDMSMQLKFEVSAEDSVSGTAFYLIVPEPGTLSLLLLSGALAFIRRR